MWSLTLLSSSVSTDVSIGPVTLPGAPPHSVLRPRRGAAPHARPGMDLGTVTPPRPTDGDDMEIRANLLEFVVFIIPWIAAVGWLCSRVLGIHLGRWRATVVAIVGWIGGVLCTALIVDKHESLWVVVPMTLFFGVIVAMPTAIVLDLITRSVRTTAPAAPPPHAAPPDPHDEEHVRTHRPDARAGPRRPPPQPRPRPVPVRARGRHRRLRAPAAPHHRGRRRDDGEVRPDRVDPHRPPPRHPHHRAREAAVERAPDRRRRRPRRDRVGVRRAGRDGVRRVRLRAARGRVDRPDPPRHARDRRARRREGAAARASPTSSTATPR